MLPMWLMIAQGVKKIADNQNEQANALNNNYLNGNDEDRKKNLFGQLFNRF